MVRLRVTGRQAALAGFLLLIFLFPGSMEAQETSPPRLFLPLRNGFLTRLALIRQLHALKVRLPDVFES